MLVRNKDDCDQADISTSHMHFDIRMLAGKYKAQIETTN